MRTVNLCREVKSVNGRTVINGGKPLLMNEVIAGCIGSLKSKDSVGAIKNYDLALKVINFKGEVKLEDVEYDKIKEALEKDMGYTDFIIGQIYKILNEVKKEN